MQEVLTFRPIAPEDASWIAPVLARAELARNTATIPHPLPEGFAARWIAEWQALRAAGDGLRLVALLGGAGAGSVALRRAGDAAELSYWVAPAFRRRGVAMAMAREALNEAGRMGVARVTAGHFCDKAGSAAVLLRLRFRSTGARQEVFSASRGAEVEALRYALPLDADTGIDAGRAQA